jgi:hypothetical protein
LMQTPKCVGPLEPLQAQTDARTKTVYLASAARGKRTLADTEMHRAAGDTLSMQQMFRLLPHIRHQTTQSAGEYLAGSP